MFNTPKLLLLMQHTRYSYISDLEMKAKHKDELTFNSKSLLGKLGWCLHRLETYCRLIDFCLSVDLQFSVNSSISNDSIQADHQTGILALPVITSLELSWALTLSCLTMEDLLIANAVSVVAWSFLIR
ncbi:unnamed protein product [Citrullus colocynthis]|uniref:Uncharacterized protein n=1 Tax=Citrullus colocynthis TaxID=252529 RepID=A0ABP0Y6C7_9ROSI